MELEIEELGLQRQHVIPPTVYLTNPLACSFNGVDTLSVDPGTQPLYTPNPSRRKTVRPSRRFVQRQG